MEGQKKSSNRSCKYWWPEKTGQLKKIRTKEREREREREGEKERKLPKKKKNMKPNNICGLMMWLKFATCGYVLTNKTLNNN